MSERATALANALGPKGWLTGADVDPLKRDYRCGVAPIDVGQNG
ncbi:hypothetical protein [Mesorhizobium caraganae]|nr:hypothetical protein [Mesorhizobium caraganae]